MSVRIRRVIVAGIVAAAAGAVPAAALASGSVSPSAKPTPTASKSAPAASKSAQVASKSAPVASKSAAAASKSAAARPGARVGRSMTGPAAVVALAGRLGVSNGAALHALQQIVTLSRQGGVEPTDPAFAAIARSLKVSPAQLTAALGAVKQVVAGR